MANSDKRPNAYCVEGQTVFLALRNVKRQASGETKISLCDLPRVLSHGAWFVSRDPKKFGKTNEAYVYVTSTHRVRLHRFILGAQNGQDVDHINHDTLDNRRENLRIVNKSQNQQNIRGAHKDSKSGIRNVYWIAAISRWHVQVCLNGKRTTFGYFSDLDEAARVATSARKSLHPYCPENSALLTEEAALWLQMEAGVTDDDLTLDVLVEASAAAEAESTRRYAAYRLCPSPKTKAAFRAAHKAAGTAREAMDAALPAAEGFVYVPIVWPSFDEAVDALLAEQSAPAKEAA